MNRRSIVLGAAALALSPDLAAAAPQPSRAPGPDEGLVYFYHVRHGKSRRQVSTYVKIDRRLVADLEVGQHTWIYLKAGEYDLGVRSGGALTGIGRTAFPLLVEAGKTHYIRYARENVGSIVIPDVTEPPAEEARAELTRSFYKPPKKEWER